MLYGLLILSLHGGPAAVVFGCLCVGLVPAVFGFEVTVEGQEFSGLKHD